MSYLEISAYGMLRGTVVQLLIHPLQTIKTRLQATSEVSSYAIVGKILEQKGGRGFYSGLMPKLIDTNIKQFWCWPLIQTIPQFLEQQKIAPLPSQALTGLFIATLDASLSTPLEGAKIRAMLSEGSYKARVRRFSGLFRFSWKGFTPNWFRLAVQWSSFLTAQSYFRNEYKQKKQSLTPWDMGCAGVKTALVVSVLAAPFDTATTLAQVSRSFFTKRPLKQMYRGWSYSALSLVIHNIASIILLEHLQKKGSR